MAAVSGENLKIMDSCYLDYSFFLESSGAFLLEIHRFLTLNPVGKVRFAIGVDNGRPVIIETKTVDEWKGSWKEAVMNDGEKLYTCLLYTSKQWKHRPVPIENSAATGEHSLSSVWY